MKKEQNIKTESVASGLVKSEWIVLDQTSETALIFKPMIHEGGVRGTLVRFKKERGKNWEEISADDFKKLKIHEGVKIELGTKQTAHFCEEILKRQQISLQGVKSGKHTYVVAETDKVIIVNDTNLKNIISEILKKEYSISFWHMLQKERPNLATKLSLGHIQEQRKNILLEYSKNLPLKGKGQERYWQDFFDNNKWIFGYGLNYQILRQKQAQPNYGGTTINGKGGQRGDSLLSTEGDVNFTVLVEIKTPATPLLQGTKAQRCGAWSISKELSDGITQLQANCAQWEIKGSREDGNRDKLEKNDVYTIAPKGILVIGRLNEIGNERSKRNTFVRFLRSINGIEIITYDQLFNRAKYIIEEVI